MALLGELDRRRETAQRHEENSARMAVVTAEFSTTGQGTLQWEERIGFDVTFTERPSIGYGSFADLEELANATSLDVDEVILPVCSGFVVEWDRDERDLYVGCWCAARVYFPLDLLGEFAVDPAATPTIAHHFTFSGIALKDIPTDVTDAND